MATDTAGRERAAITGYQAGYQDAIRDVARKLLDDGEAGATGYMMDNLAMPTPDDVALRKALCARLHELPD